MSSQVGKQSSGQAEAGKGSAPRKTNDQSAYASNWDRIFKKKVDAGAPLCQSPGYSPSKQK